MKNRSVAHSDDYPPDPPPWRDWLRVVATLLAVTIVIVLLDLLLYTIGLLH